MKKAFIIFAATLAFSAAHAQAAQYRVIGIMDGDTAKVLSSDNQQVKCRLHAVDSPEKNQPYGQRAKDSLSEMIYGKTVDVEVVDRDQYGRSVCRISLNGVDINKLQVQRGMAWHYTRYSKDATYGQAEAAARQQRLGLWADTNPTPPWAFRLNEKTARYR